MSNKAQDRKTAIARRRRRTQLRVMVLSLFGLGLVMVALPTVVVLVVGMLPSLTWYIVDMTPGRFAFRCISRFNIAGVAPFMYTLWTHGNDMTTAIDIVTDPFAWISFLGASGAGWLVYTAVPAIVTLAHELYAKNQIETMDELQQELEQEWGAAVRGKTEQASEPKADAPADGESAEEKDTVPA